MAGNYKIEHLEKAPRGWKIRTAMSGAHRVRIAFPPGARRKGSGRAVEILHPQGENPACAMNRSSAQSIAAKFPAELVRSGGGKTAKRRNRKKNAAELVIFNPKGKRKQHKKGKGAGPGFVIKTRRRKRLNPDEMQEAIQLYEKFHGADPSKILEVQESAAMRSTYAGLGDLVELLVKRADGRTVQMQFEGDRVKVAANPAGTQIYFLGGNQNLNGALAEFDADTTKDFIELGECVRIMYFTRKEADGFQPVDYHHKFGEEGGARPVLIYNKVQRRMLLAGGDYKVEAPGIIN